MAVAHVKGLESLRHKLGLLAAADRLVVRAELEDAAERIEHGARERAPKGETKHLSKSITHEAHDLELAQRIGTNDFKAKWHEFGTVKMSARPFLFPAFEEERPQFLRRLVQALNRSHRRVAR